MSADIIKGEFVTGIGPQGVIFGAGIYLYEQTFTFKIFGHFYIQIGFNIGFSIKSFLTPEKIGNSTTIGLGFIFGISWDDPK